VSLSKITVIHVAGQWICIFMSPYKFGALH
jgi:hypothetical protein